MDQPIICTNCWGNGFDLSGRLCTHAVFREQLSNKTGEGFSISTPVDLAGIREVIADMRKSNWVGGSKYWADKLCLAIGESHEG